MIRTYLRKYRNIFVSVNLYANTHFTSVVRSQFVLISNHLPTENSIQPTIDLEKPISKSNIIYMNVLLHLRYSEHTHQNENILEDNNRFIIT